MLCSSSLWLLHLQLLTGSAHPVFQRSGSAANPEQQVKLEDVLPLAFTRLCEPKEASYSLIKKYVSQYYPKLKVDVR